MDIHEITRFIGETQYKKEITDLGLKYHGGELLELALNRNMATMYHQILEFCEGDLRTMLAAYLRREDLRNIKTILRGIFYKATPDDIMKTIIPAGAYSEAYWRTVVQHSTTLDEVIEQLRKSEFFEPLVSLRKEYGDNLSAYENHLQITYYQTLLQTIQSSSKPTQLFREFIRREIDLVNLKTLFMTKYENVESQIITPMMILGGLISEKEIHTLVSTVDFKGFLQEFRKLPWYDSVKEKIDTIEQAGTLNHVIRGLEKSSLARETKQSIIYPLSILPILEFLLKKRQEVENLRIIARGKQSGLSDSLIRELVVM
jgi:V/A-type H+-transporting ATPase subunit C